MSQAQFQEMKQKLLNRVISGEITQEEYKSLLQEIESLETSQFNLSTSESSETSSGSSPQSIGGFVTNPGTQQSSEESQMLGDYRLDNILGKGGMGEVWRAYDTVGNREVVIKLLPKELASNSGEMERVKQTFQKIHSLNHQNICPTYALGKAEETGYYLVMKYLDGGTLSRYRQAYLAKHGEFTTSEVIRILKKVAEALDYAHEQRVIHRDIKPDNIMISRDGKAVHLVDFGLAAEIRSTMSRVSQVQMDVSGTYPYMAPEQWKGAYQDNKTDQYALGVVAYEMFTGQLPFDAPDSFVMRQCVLNEPPSDIKIIPAHMNAAICKALAKDRNDRFINCIDFISALSESSSAKGLSKIDESESLVIAEENSVPIPIPKKKEAPQENWKKNLPTIPTGPPSPPEISKKAGFFSGNPANQVPDEEEKAIVQVSTLVMQKDFKKARWQIEVMLNRNNVSSGLWYLYGQVLKNIYPSYNLDKEKAYVNAISLKKEDADCWTALGITLREKGEMEQAKACYIQSIELNPTQADAYTSLCTLLILTKKFKESIKWGEQAVEYDESNAVAWSNLAIAYHYNGMKQKSQDAAQKAKLFGYADMAALESIFSGKVQLPFV